VRVKELKEASRSHDASLDSVLRIHENACDLLRGESWRFAAVYYPVLAGSELLTSSSPKDPDSCGVGRRLAWRLQDALLAELRRVAGATTNILLVSPHGPTHPVDGTQASRETDQQLGLFCMAGPQVRFGKTHYGGTVLDVAPTALRLLGLIEDADTDGEPWLDCLDLGSRSSVTRSLEPILTATQFASMPRPEPQPAPGEVFPADAKACSQVRENQRVNLALALADSDRRQQAITCWRDLLSEHPGNHAYAAMLIAGLMSDRQYEECRQIIDRLLPEVARQATFQLTLAEIAVAEGRHDEASAIAATQSALSDIPAPLLLRAAHVLSACNELAAAENCFLRSINSERQSVVAHAGLANLYWEQGDAVRSIAEARKALTMAPAYTEARFTLARSLHRTGQKAESIAHFERCVRDQWRPHDSHSYLASLHWADDPVRAAQHREMANVA
jgi:tetratricopeptide (TPR) repeat protein